MSPGHRPGLDCMTRTTCHLSISLDGFVAGPDQSLDQPLGVGGLALHRWHLDDPDHEADVAAQADLMKQRGAYVMGRNMFGPVRGPWDQEWRGWWGDEPPYHAPVFVLTHHPHEPIEMAGGTTFHFVTAGFEAALSAARSAAGDLDVAIAGGASTVRQALVAGAVDEMMLDIAPILLGSGERLLDGVPDPGLEPVEVLGSPRATHVRYRVTGQAPGPAQPA
jgi:dihydrofolate reductase